MTSEVNTSNSFAALIEKSSAYDANKFDTVASSSKMKFGEDGRFTVPASIDRSGAFGLLNLGLEETALNQLGERLGRHFWDASKRVIPSDFYRQMHKSFPQHFGPFTNELLGKAATRFLVRGYEDKARAILSDQYATLDNTEFLDMASQVLHRVPFQVVESGKYYSKNDGVQRDDMTVRVVVKNVLPPEEGGGYGLGVMIRNGETGGGASHVQPLIMRSSCMNSIVFRFGDAGERLGLSLHHRGSKTSKITLLAAAIAEALPMAEEGLEKFLETKNVEIDLGAVIGKLGEDKGWGEEVKLAVATGTEGRSTVYGLINGITWAAHEADISTYDRFDLESLASKFVYEPAYARRLEKAAAAAK